MVLLLSLACKPDAPAEDVLTEVSEAPLEDPMMEAGLLAGLQFALQADITAPWRGLSAANTYAMGACPAQYSGEPPDNDLAGTGAVGPGTSWSDACDAGDTSYRGFMYWESAFSGDVSTGAERLLIGDSSVVQGDQVLYEFDGNARDSYSATSSAEGQWWEYEATVSAIIGGDLTYGGTATPGGIQEDLFVYYTGGDEQFVEAIGNVYLYSDLIAGTFDSVYLDMEYQGTRGASDGECTAEPRGTIGLRDADAHWYYVVFEPKYNSTLDFENAEYSACDGCGTAYYRGFEQPSRLCPDFSSLWDTLAPPLATEFPL